MSTAATRRIRRRFWNSPFARDLGRVCESKAVEHAQNILIVMAIMVAGSINW